MITTSVCNSYKVDCQNGVHQPSHTYKIALYNSEAELTETTQAYTASSEVVGLGYTAGGKELAGRTVTLFNNVACLDFSTVQWDDSTISSAGALIYNSSVTGKNAIATFYFGKTVVSSNGPFKAVMPDPGETTSVIGLS